jgi:hypothetical protein
MKNVNLLPAWYLQQRRRQRNLKLHVFVMMLIGGVMVGLSLLGGERVAKLNRQHEQIALRLDSTPNPEAQLRKVKVDLQRLQDLQKARQELGNTVPMSSVIQQLQNAMTPGMALSNIAIDVQPQPIKGSGVVGDQRNPPRYHEVAHLTLTGVAVEDRNIASLFKELTNNRLFSDVTLNYNRTGALRGYPVRKFEIQLSMDLEKLITQSPESRAAEPLASGGNSNGE